ncbi:hypothetical protein Tco_1396105 [Tanacetum coccineum]
MFKTGSHKSLPEHIVLYEALEASMECAQRDELLAEKDKSRKRRCDDQDPPPPPDSDLSKRRRHDAGASGSSQPQAPQSLTSKKSDTRDAPSGSSKQQSEDTDSAHLPKTKQRPEWLKPIPDYERPATPEPARVIPTSHIPDATFMNRYCQKMGKTKLTQADLEGQAYEVIDWANPEGDQVRIDISKPLPLSGPPGHVTIQTQFFFNKDLDYLRYDSKGSGQALLISKIKATRYHDFGLELLVPEHMWIDYICTYDISASYGFEFKHDYTIIDSPRAVVFPVSNNERKIMRFNEIYMFSDGMLTNIMEALDYRVKEYKVNRLNPGINTYFWTDKDVERSKEFIHAIERRLKTRRIFQNLECFVGGQVRDIDYILL